MNYLDPKLFILILITLFNAFFAFFILLRNRRSDINRAYFAFVLSLVFWATAIVAFFVTKNLILAKLTMQLTYLAAIFIALSFLNFANVFPFRNFRLNPISKLCLIASTVLAGLVVFWPNYLVQEVFINNGQRVVDLNRLGHTVFAFYFLTFSATILYIFADKYLKSDGAIKVQLRYVALGCFLTLGLGVFFNLIFTGLGNHRYIWLGPYFTAANTVLVSYTINFSKKMK